jgi:acyl dehydratase
MFGAIIAKHLISELGQNASIVKMKLRYLSMVMIGETVKFDFDVADSRLVNNMTVLNVLINVKVEKDNRDVLKPVEVEIKL